MSARNDLGVLGAVALTPFAAALICNVNSSTPRFLVGLGAAIVFGVSMVLDRSLGPGKSWLLRLVFVSLPALSYGTATGAAVRNWLSPALTALIAVMSILVLGVLGALARRIVTANAQEPAMAGPTRKPKSRRR